MRRLNATTRVIFVLAFSVVLTTAVFMSSSLGAELPVAVAAPAASTQAAPGDTYCVAVISNTYPGCTQVFTNVQAAIDTATGFETIKVSQGTYTHMNSRPIPDGYFGLGGDITQALYLTKTVFIQGGYTTTNWTTPDPVAHPTTLNAQSKGRVVVIAGDITPTLTGLRFTGGKATNLGGFDNSFAAPPDATDVGGGIFIVSATATISNSWVYSNTANDDPLLPFSAGGGIYLANSPSILYGTTVATNTALYGGGVLLFFSGATLSHDLIFNNTAIGDGSGGGGGAYLESSSATIDHSTIRNNLANYGNGGGVAISSGTATLSENVIVSNRVIDPFTGGGGVYLTLASVSFKNNLIADNQITGLGAGVYLASSDADFRQTTLAQNTGGGGSGIYLDNSGTSTVWLTNTILISHSIGLVADSGTTANLDSTLFGGGTNTSGAGTINSAHPYSGNPGFVNPAAGNYHINSSSAAIDQGLTTGVSADIDGDPRPSGLSYDLGADEFYNPALTATKHASASSALPGAVITYTIHLTNTGNVTLTTYISDTVPPSMTFKGPVTVNPAGGTTGNPPGIAGGQSLGLGKSITVTFPVTLNIGAGMTAGSIITNSAALTTSPSTLIAQPINALASITIQNAAPIAVNDSYTTPANSTINMSVRDNDTDPNGDALTITAVGAPFNGTASISGGASVIYTPTTTPSFVGTDSFTYTVRDPIGAASTATIVVDVINLPVSGLAAQNSSPNIFGQATLFTATIASGTNVSYLWNFGDGSTTVGPTASHTYAGIGNYTAIVTASNSVPSTASATTAVTITKATPVATITADVPDPSVVGQSVGITFTVTPPGAGTPTGVVTVTDGSQLCTANLPVTTCVIAFTSIGAKTLTAQYSGDSNFNSASSSGAAHTVNKAGTTTGISSIAPNPALFGQSTAITTSVIVNAPGVGTPTGVITITDGTVSCTATLPTTSCSLIFNVLGTHTITATYSGDANFNTSNGTSPLTVNDVPITALAAQNNSPMVFGQSTFFTATIATGTNVSYVWNFGDGLTTTGALASHTYAAVGTYTATITATNTANNQVVTTAVTITKATPAVAVTADVPDPSVVGQSVAITFTVTPPGAGTPTGVITITDGTQACSATLPTTMCNISFATPGVKSITAQYSGDTNFIGATSINVVHTVNKASTTIAITSDTPDPSVFGQSVPITFTLSVNVPGSGTPTGVVTVTDGTQFCTAALPTTSCAIAFTSIGAKTLTAQYSGDANISGSTSIGTAHTVNKAGTTTSISSIVPNPALHGQSTAITASLSVTAPGVGTPTGVITITDGSITCIANLPATSCNLTFTVLGSHTISATYSGDANFNGSNGTSPLTVNDVPVAGLAAQNSSPTRLDDATFFTATLTTGTNVTYVWNFGDGSPTVNGANVSHTYAVSSTYTAIVTATNSFNSQSASTPVTITNQRPVAVAFNNTFSLNATVALDGSGSFDPDNHTPLTYFWTQTGGTGVSFTPNLSVTTFTAPGAAAVLTFSLTVTDTHGLASLPKQIVITIADLPITGLAAHNSSPTAYGVTTQFSTTLSSGSSVTYQWNFGDGNTGSGAGTSHTYATPGNYTAIVTATNALPSIASATTAVTITKATPTVAITSDTPDPSVVGQSVPIAFAVTPPGIGTPTGTVTVTDGTQSCATNVASGTCSLTFTSPGSKTLTAQYSGDTFFNGAASSNVAHQVNQAGTTTSISSIAPNPALFGQSTAITVSLTINSPGAGTPTGTINITDGTVGCTAPLPTPSSCSVTFNTLGTHPITATYSGDANFATSSTNSSLPVNDIPIAGLVAVNTSPTRLGDATYFTATITAGTNASYLWDFGDSSPTTTGATVTHSYASSGTYTATATVSNSANSPSVSTQVLVTNQPPVAVALNDGVSPGLVATLDGHDSFDPDNHTPLSYFWTQTGGTGVSFTPDLSVTTFTAPTSPTVLTFTLIVTDAFGLPSAPAQATITVADLAITNLSASNNSPTILGSVTAFTATQTGGTSVTYVWDFGDGLGTGTSAHPSYTYPSVGTYTATVTATNAVNQLTRTTQVIIGVPVSGLAASSNSPQFTGASTVFTATIAAGTNVAYQWAFGDGGTGSGVNPTHVYGTPGSYTAVVTATNLFGWQVATTTVTSLAQAELSVIATAAPDPASVGSPLVYTLAIRNSGPTNADNVVITDTLPSGLTFGSAATTQGTCGLPTVTCNIGTLINGGTVTVTIVVTPSMLIISPVIITNTAGVSSATTDPNPADNVATVTTTVYPRRVFLPIIKR
jgi:large repetitive protein